jgi:hypothetical protein
MKETLEEAAMITDWLDEHGDPEIYKKVEKQLELEEAANIDSKNHYKDQSDYWAIGFDSFKRGAKWQKEQAEHNDWAEVNVILLVNFLKMPEQYKIHLLASIKERRPDLFEPKPETEAEK